MSYLFAVVATDAVCAPRQNGRFCVVNHSGRYLNARSDHGRTVLFFWRQRIDLPFRGDRVEHDGISTKLITIRKATVEARHDKLQFHGVASSQADVAVGFMAPCLVARRK